MASILLKDKTGCGQSREGEELFESQCHAFRGELLVQIPEQERCRIKGVTPNYRLYRDPQVILRADPVDVVPLDERELEYLLAVQPVSVRVKEYLNEEDKKMKMDLIIGDKVVFKLKLGSSASASKTATPTASVNGIIRYIGPHPDSDGIVFGIIIQDQAYLGKGTSNGSPHFTCGSNNAVFVAMDKIIKKPDSPRTRSSQQLSIPVVMDMERPKPSTRSQTKPATSGQPKSVVDRLKGFVKDAVSSLDDNAAEDGVRFELVDVSGHKSRFKEGDHVILQTVKKEVVAGTVRWVGPVRVSEDIKVDPLPVVGIETDKKIDLLKDFDGVDINFTTKLFSVMHNHGQVFLPEQMVLFVNEYTMQVQKDSAAKFQQGKKESKQDDATEEEKKLAEEFGMSVVEYRRQQQSYVDVAKQGKDDRKVHVPDDPEIGDVEEKYAAGGGMIGRYRGRGEGLNELTGIIQVKEDTIQRVKEEGRALEVMKSTQQQQRQENYKDDNERGKGDNNQYRQPNLPAMAEGLRLQQPQQSPKAQRLYNEEGERETANLPSLLNDGARNHYSPRNDPSHRCDHNCDHQSPDDQDHHDHDNQDPNHHQQDQYNHPPDPPHQFTIGSMVHIDTQRGDPLYGVVKWIGPVPDYPETIAGVELEKTLNGGTDGTWQGTRFFTCPYGKGYFCPLNILKQDTRYVYMTQSDAPADFQSVLTADPEIIPCVMEEDHPKDKHLLYANDNNITEVTDAAEMDIDIQSDDEFKKSLYKLQQERPQSLQDAISKKPPSSFEGIISIQQQMHADLAWYSTNFDNITRRCEELFDNLEETRNSFRQRESQLQEDYTKMKERNEDLASLFCSVQNSHNNLTKEHEQLQKSHDALTANQDKLFKSHDTITAKHQKLQNLYHNLTENHQELQMSHDSLRSKYQMLQMSHDSLKKEHQDLQKSNTTLTMSHEELQKSHDSLKITNQDEVIRHQKLQEENENRLQEVNQRLVQTQNEVAELQNTLQKLENNWKVSHTDVALSKEELGRGGWGVIWIGKFRGQKVAVKQMHDVIKSEENMKLLHREINTMSQLRHPNLLQFIGAVLDHPSGNPMIITEVMDTSLRKAYDSKKLTPDPSCRPVILSIMRDVAVGLNYLHHLPDPIIHRDVSSANVLLESKGDKKWKTKMSDFGSANLARVAVTEVPGAAIYSAPESIATLCWKKRKQTPKMDSYSYGVLLCEVLTCHFPDVETFESLSLQVKASSPQLHELIVLCIDEEPDKRPTMPKIIVQLD